MQRGGAPRRPLLLMAIDYARIVLQAQGRPAEYTSPGGSPVAVRAKVREVDADIRMNRTMKMYGAQALGAMAESDDPERGGLIAIDGSEYRIDGTTASSVRGLVELNLTRMSGKALQSHDLSSAALAGPRSEMISVDGFFLKGNINRSGLLLEEDGFGEGVEVVRTVILVRASDLPEGTDSGSIVVLESGEELEIQYTKKDGLSMVRMVCS